jgi:heat shock protein HslJ
MTSDQRPEPEPEPGPTWDDETLVRLLDRGVADVVDAPAPVRSVVTDGDRLIRRHRQVVALCCATLAVGGVSLAAAFLATTGKDVPMRPDRDPVLIASEPPVDDATPTTTPAPGPVAGTPVDTAAIQGSWQVESMRDYSLVDGRFRFTENILEPDLTMSFDGDSWTAKTGCYFESAQFDLVDGEFANRDPMTGSGSACAQGTVETDWIANISNVMMRTDHVTIGAYGRLSLTVDQMVVATLTPAADHQPTEPGDATAADLVGRWDVTIPGVVVDGVPQVETHDDVAMTLEFTSNGQFKANDGCKNVDGTYSVTGRDASLRFIVPAVGCSTPPPPLTGRLADVRHATTGPHQQIYLHASNYEIILVLKPQ